MTWTLRDAAMLGYQTMVEKNISAHVMVTAIVNAMTVSRVTALKWLRRAKMDYLAGQRVI